MISPELATLTSRDATFIASPIAVYCSARVDPIDPVITFPVLIPIPIRIGIGINTGNVITGSIGSTRALQYTAIGDAMNVASRLVNVASSGEIIVSEDTYRYLAGRVEATALPPVKVKGKAEELKVYR